MAKGLIESWPGWSVRVQNQFTLERACIADTPDDPLLVVAIAELDQSGNLIENRESSEARAALWACGRSD
jgi:hypothetical protein